MSEAIVQIIEDEPLHAALLDRALRHAHFATSMAADGHSGWQDLQRLLPSLILLDLMLPGLSGQEICRLVRITPSTRHIPIVIVTAIGSEADRVAGLEMGADDYVVKPFSPREVVSRVRAVLRRPDYSTIGVTRTPHALLTVQGPCFVASVGTRELIVSGRELALLRFLITREDVLVSAEELMALQREDSLEILPKELDQDVRALRRKLENSGAGSLEILPGYRYRFLSHPQSG
jgi:DNA-binding response OmpR family regulator